MRESAEVARQEADAMRESAKVARQEATTLALKNLDMMSLKLSR